MSSADETAKEAGRGGLAIAGAKITFMVLGMAQKVLLTFLLGVAGFGHLQRIFTPLNLVNNVTVGSAIQGVSHVVSSANEAERPAAFRRALAVHAVLAGIAGLGFFVAAPFVASFLEAEHITGELRFVALIVAVYGIYAPLVGSLNGTRRFTTQAGLDVTYAILRTGGLAIGALVGGIGGALVGFTAAALAIVPIAALRSGLGKRGEGGQTTKQLPRLLRAAPRRADRAQRADGHRLHPAQPLRRPLGEGGGARRRRPPTSSSAPTAARSSSRSCRTSSSSR